MIQGQFRCTFTFKQGCLFRPQKATTKTIRNSRVIQVQATKLPEALLFDCDGVLVDTEKDGHRVAFNNTFKQKGLSHEWGVELYGKLVEIGGGKERMTSYFSGYEDQEPFLSIKDDEERKEYIKGLHKLKTQLFMDMITDGQMPLRPGVKRLINDAIGSGIKVAVCSTSNEKAVQNIVDVLLGADVSKVMKVFAGDVVPKKKPDPAIYLLAAQELGVAPENCVVIEDSRIGLLAAKAAGMRCIVTKSSYTQRENFAEADEVVDYIGEVGDEKVSVETLMKDPSVV
eukprot:TRINITY_DN16123_c0_g1_i8.p1 TRINITY_DN16123_c0_g1~~TRINITY_DN16123_c0_g1_i8.p1  ORF type:complete len:285 (-),score=47.28 TRINITY_DN16123_c0_g1_i8:73-927(-)